jgi:pimeloyl-ACP methyl ester carboxylesterase
LTATGESAPVAVTEGYAEANGLRIYYREAGEGPPLILVHGGLATGEVMWSPRIVAELAAGHRVLIPDSRGHGRTDNPAGRMRYDQMADDVAAFSAALGLERPVVIGYSDGAQVALEIGLRHPELAVAMVIGGVVTRPVEGYLQALREMGFPEPGAVDLPQVEQAMGDFYATLRTSHEHARGDEDFRRYLAEISALWYSVPDYTDAQLAGIGVPSLVIVGDRDGVSVEESLRLYRLLPRGELAVVPNADHGAGDRKVFWAAVADFLSRHVPRAPDASAA